jgi:hypothetical protein
VDGRSPTGLFKSGSGFKRIVLQAGKTAPVRGDSGDLPSRVAFELEEAGGTAREDVPRAASVSLPGVAGLTWLPARYRRDRAQRAEPGSARRGGLRPPRAFGAGRPRGQGEEASPSEGVVWRLTTDAAGIGPNRLYPKPVD